MPTTLRQRRRAHHADRVAYSVVESGGVRGVIRRGTRQARRDAARINEPLVASGVQLGAEVQADQIRRLKERWQTRALVYYDLVPEIKNAGQFYSRHMSKIELRVERYDPQTDEWTPAPDSPASNFLDRIQDPGGGRSSLIGTYGRLRFLTGESYLVCFAPDTDAESWEMLSADEFQPKEDGKSFLRKRGENLQPEEWRLATPAKPGENPDDRQRMCTAWRLWRRHPRFSAQADSSLQACMDLCEELLLLTLAVRAQTRSRIARSGILKVPSEISPPPREPRPNEDPQEDKFLRTLAMHMEAPIADEGSPAGLVPLIIRGPAEALAQLQQLELNVTGANYPEAGLRTECISRLATGLDMPREALLGTADVNHWGAWQIDQQTWEAHVQPVVEEMCDEFTGAILRPTLEDNGIQGAETRLYRVWYDAVKITNHPDRGKDAVDAFDRGELNGEALRSALAFDDSDAPSTMDRARWVGVRTRDAGLAWYGVPTLRTQGAEAEPPPPPQDVVAPGEGEGETPPAEGGTGNDTPIGPPAAARLLGAAENALFSCRRVAGNRIVSKAPRDRDVQAMLRSIDSDLLYAKIDRTLLPTLNGGSVTDPRELVRGGTESFKKTLEAWGYPPDRIDAISRLVERHAAETLHETQPRALPPVLLNL